MELAFIGLGYMGEPMATNLVRAGVDLIVWNRSQPSLDRLIKLGARAARTARDAFRQSDVSLLMLANERAIDEVLERNSPEFVFNVSSRLIVHMGTTSPGYSQGLGSAIEQAGGRYVEAPVSGSRVPAENGALVGMLAGFEPDMQLVSEILPPVCRQTFRCGAVPNALTMKLAVNLFLITMVSGLAEAAHFASSAGLDMEQFRAILDAGPMASDVSKVKLDKLLRNDFTPQASLADVLMNNRLVADAARAMSIGTPLLDQSHQLFAVAERQGLGAIDMIGVIRAIDDMSAHPSEFSRGK